MITAAHLGFAFVTAGWLTFVAAVIVVAAHDVSDPESKPKEKTDAVA